ncbi:MAG: NYN domain-containing protein [Actinomycetota bacterium]|nr:MAG: hypothetical protein FD171_1095 [Actinomycetota bacterium]MDO8949513.1 NYN domain-containing protein [Actinomycetota bacterium]MDP3629476.1 NYN domain-containing protein [Actinomycetota bacterium]
MRHLIDGYNVTMNDPATRALPAEEQRDALVQRLATRGAQLLGAGTLTVVFDGRTDDARPVGGMVDVRFSGDETADDVIVRLAAAEQGEVTVVSSDRDLTARASASASGRVRVLGCESLFEAVRPKRRGTRYPAASAGLPKGANLITEELKKLWLEDGK